MRTEEESRGRGWLRLPRKRWFLLAAALYAGYYFGLRTKLSNVVGISTGRVEPELAPAPFTESHSDSDIMADTGVPHLQKDAEATSLVESAEKDATERVHLVYSNGTNISSEEPLEDQSAQLSEPTAVAATEFGCEDVRNANSPSPSESAQLVTLLGVDAGVEDLLPSTQLHPEVVSEDALASQNADNDRVTVSDEATLRSMPDWLLPDYEDVPATEATEDAEAKSESKLIPKSLIERISAYHQVTMGPRQGRKDGGEKATAAEQEPKVAVSTTSVDETPADTSTVEAHDASPPSTNPDVVTNAIQTAATAEVAFGSEHQDQRVVEPKYIRIRRRRYNRSGQ